MRSLLSFAPWVLLASSVTASVLPGAYIVEFANDDESADSFMSSLSAANVDAKLRMSLAHHPTFHGASFHVADEAADVMDTISTMASVKNVWPVRLHSTKSVIHGTYPREVIQKRDINDTYSTHVMGNVDKLHDLGLSGSGIKIAVVDTGIDYLHPSLGGGFGPGYKVAFGTDLVGDDYSGWNTPVPDDDPMDCGGHGTHVAGIMGAEDDLFTGVAYNATLGIYKVFGCPGGEAGSASDDVLIHAFSLAFEEGVDLISASIGGSVGWSEEAWAVAIQRIVAAGTPCIIAAGNEGDEGLLYASDGSNGIGAIAVGSVDNTLSPEVLTVASYVVSSNSSNNTFGYTPATGSFNDTTLPLYVVTPDTTVTEDACDALPDDTPDLSNYLVLIRRGVCSFDDKVSNAMAKGAKYVMLYNNVPGVIAASITVSGIVAGMVSPEVGAAWIADVSSGSDVTVTFSSDAGISITSVVNDLSGGYMSTFTTWGPTNELHGRPHISAPGGNILSTYLTWKDSYAVLSGTSMATPYIAGVVALFKEAKGKAISPDVIRSLLTTTGRPLSFNDGSETYDILAPTAQQGGGLVDAYSMIYTPLTVDVDQITLNDTEFNEKTTTLTFTNAGDNDATYYISNTGAASAYVFEANSTVVQVFPPDLEDIYSTASFSSNSFKLAAGESTQVTVTIDPPAGLDVSRIPVYGGWISISDSSNTTSPVLSIPYMGVDAAMNSFNVTDFGSGFPSVTSNITNSTGVTSFSSPSEGPNLNWRLTLPSRIIRLDVASVSDPSLNTLSLFPNSTSSSYLGAVPGYPATLLERSDSASYNTTTWNWTVTTGANEVGPQASVPLGGTYKFLWRALRMFGNETVENDWDFWESDSFVVGSNASAAGYLANSKY